MRRLRGLDLHAAAILISLFRTSPTAVNRYRVFTRSSKHRAASSTFYGN